MLGQIWSMDYGVHPYFGYWLLQQFQFLGDTSKHSLTEEPQRACCLIKK